MIYAVQEFLGEKTFYSDVFDKPIGFKSYLDALSFLLKRMEEARSYVRSGICEWNKDDIKSIMSKISSLSRKKDVSLPVHIGSIRIRGTKDKITIKIMEG